MLHWIAHYRDLREICCLPFECCSFAGMVLYSCDDDDDDSDDDDSNHRENVNCYIAFFSL
jgi:hypothetical protein